MMSISWCESLLNQSGQDITLMTMCTKNRDPNSNEPYESKQRHWSAPYVGSDVVPMLDGFLDERTPEST